MANACCHVAEPRDKPFSMFPASFKWVYLSVFLLQAWNKYSPLPPSRGQNGKKPLSLPQQLEKTPERVVRPGRSRAAENLPADSQDPYSSLSIEAQAFVNNLTGMGFPRSRASRAVLKLGQDDKLVCTLSHLWSTSIELKYCPCGRNP